MSLLSTEEYLRRGHQIDLDMLNLDSAIGGLVQEGAVPSGDKMTWDALYAEWQHDYHVNIESVPLSPWQFSDLLDTWTARVQQWRNKAAKWSLVSSKRAHDIVSALPDSPALIEAAERPAAGALPTWAWMIFGVSLTAAVGYTLSGVARIGGR